MELPESEARTWLAEQAARRARAGLDPLPVLGGLRLLTTAELLCPAPPPRRTIDAAGVLEGVCAAVCAGVRRRPGWLYAMIPPGQELPLLVPGRLLQAAVLCALRGALRTGGSRAVVRCLPEKDALLLCMQGGAASLTSADTVPLWKRLAAQGGGTAVFGAGPVFTAAARLPLHPGTPAPCPAAEELLRDRYSLPYVYLGDWFARPWV